MSQSQSALSASSSYRLTKYSWAPGPSTQPARFTERTDPKLSLVIGTSLPRTRSSGISIRVVLGTQDLESMPVTALVAESTRLCQAVQNAGRMLAADQLPIFGFWRDSNLAIQYHDPVDGIKRVQAKFVHVVDCQEVVRYLQGLGLQIEEKPQRPSTARSKLSSRAETLPAADHTLPSSEQVYRPSTVGTGSEPAITTSNATERFSSTSSVYQNRPDQSIIPNTSISPFFDKSGTHKDRAGTSSTDAFIAPNDGKSNMQDFMPPVRDLPFMNTAGPAVRARPRSAAELPQLPRPTPREQPSHRRRKRKGDELDPDVRAEAAYKKPDRSDSSFFRAKITSPKGALRLEPPNKAYDLRSQNWQAESQPIDYRTTPLPTSRATTGRAMPSPPTSSPEPRSATIDAPAQRTPLAELSGNAAIRTVSSSSQDDAQGEVEDELGNFLYTSDDKHATNDRVNLGQYAARPKQQRMAALNEFICQNLDSDDFKTLCMDVENCWQRIGLGL